MLITESKLREIIQEELTKTDKDQIATIARRETKKLFKDEFMSKVEKEIETYIKSRQNKDEVIDLVKKVLIKVYKELAFNQPHVIRQVSVR